MLILISLLTAVPLFAQADNSNEDNAEIQIERYIQKRFGGDTKVLFFDKITENRKQKLMLDFQRIVSESKNPIDFSKVASIYFASGDGSRLSSSTNTYQIKLDLEGDPAGWLIALSQDPSQEALFINYVKRKTSHSTIAIRKLAPEIATVHEAAEKFLCAQTDIRTIANQTAQEFMKDLFSLHAVSIEKTFYQKSGSGDPKMKVKAIFKGQSVYVVDFDISYGNNHDFANRYNHFTYASFEIFRGEDLETLSSISSSSVSGIGCDVGEIHWNVFENEKMVKRMRAQSPYWRVDSELILNPDPSPLYPSRPSNIATLPLIAIIDSGVDYNHLKLMDLVRVNEGMFNAKYANRISFDKLERYKKSFGWDFNEDDELPYPYAESLSLKGFIHHGTHVSGIASGDYFPLLPVRYKSGKRMLDAIHYASFKGAKIINLSLGSYEYDDWKYLQEAIRMYPEILFVAAAGNEAVNIDQKPSYPAAFEEPNLLVVAAVNGKGQLASFSNWGAKRVHVAAEGVDIESYKAGGGTIVYSGTSMATPYVSYLAAQILERNNRLAPSDVIKDLERLCMPSADLQSKVRCGGFISKK